MEKKEKLLPQLLAYAGKRKVLTYLSMVIAGISQLLALAPFLYIWAILRDVIAGDYSRIAHYGLMAVAGADKIVVLKEGTVDECGSPSELTASKCGFTPQYDGLEALFRQYKDKGLVVIGFPCDQFGHQEPGTNEEIEEFCRLNHGVTFPLMAKSDVNGENANAIFKWLYSEKPFAGFGEGDTAMFMDHMLSSQDPDYASNPDIKWNFTKFLVDRKGRVVARFEPVVTPEELTSFIEEQL